MGTGSLYGAMGIARLWIGARIDPGPASKVHPRKIAISKALPKTGRRPGEVIVRSRSGVKPHADLQA